MQTIRNILTDELGYDIHEKVLCSLDFGLPQKRERWYCVGFKKETLFEFPKGKKQGAVLRDIIDLDNDDPSLKISKFELDRIKYHFEHASEIRVKHDNSKYARLNRFNIINFKHVYRLVFGYIETFYNTVRIHSHCDYMSPSNFEKLYERVCSLPAA